MRQISAVNLYYLSYVIWSYGVPIVINGSETCSNVSLNVLEIGFGSSKSKNGNTLCWLSAQKCLSTGSRIRKCLHERESPLIENLRKYLLTLLLTSENTLRFDQSYDCG